MCCPLVLGVLLTSNKMWQHLAWMIVRVKLSPNCIANLSIVFIVPLVYLEVMITSLAKY